MEDGKKMKINILYEDNHLLVVEKPINMLSQSDNTKDEDLHTLLKKYLKLLLVNIIIAKIQHLSLFEYSKRKNN